MRRLSWQERQLAILFVVAGVVAIITAPWIGSWIVTLSGWDWWGATLAVICGLFVALVAVLGVLGIFVLWDNRWNQRKKPIEWFDEPVERASLAVILVAVLLAAAGVAVAWLGFRYLHPEWTLKDLTTDFYANLAVDLVSLGVTVLIIDRLYDWRSKLEEKQRISEQMKSPSAEFAKEAFRIVTEKGWFKDGSLMNANLNGIHLEGVDLEGASLQRVRLWMAWLEGARMKEADLRGADLVWANLRRANLELADLRRANLEGASLQRVRLMGARLQRANLEGALLNEADLRWAKLTFANLAGADLTGATYNAKTQWPKGFDPMAAGAVLED